MNYRLYTHDVNGPFSVLADAASDADLFRQYVGVPIDSYERVASLEPVASDRMRLPLSEQWRYPNLTPAEQAVTFERIATDPTGYFEHYPAIIDDAAAAGAADSEWTPYLVGGALLIALFAFSRRRRR